jgi:uncharacterized membrane protein YqhA
MIFYFLIAYIAIGIILNFVEPLEGEIWVAQMNAASNENVSALKIFLFTCVIRIGVVLFYPIFLLKR